MDWITRTLHASLQSGTVDAHVRTHEDGRTPDLRVRNGLTFEDAVYAGTPDEEFHNLLAAADRGTRDVIVRYTDSSARVMRRVHVVVLPASKGHQVLCHALATNENPSVNDFGKGTKELLAALAALPADSHEPHPPTN